MMGCCLWATEINSHIGGLGVLPQKNENLDVAFGGIFILHVRSM